VILGLGAWKHPALRSIARGVDTAAESSNRNAVNGGGMRGNHCAVFRHCRWAVVVVTTLLAACTGSAEPPDPADPVVELRMEPVTTTSLTGTVGMKVTPIPIVRVATQDGSPASGIEIDFAVSGDGVVAIASARTDTGGRATAGTWTLGSATGAQTVTARSAGLPDVVFTAIAESGPVAKITRMSGDSQMGLTRAAVANPLRVRVTDRFGNPVSGAPVSFVVLFGDGTIDGAAAIADGFGLATSGAWTLGTGSGTQQVRAEANGAETVFTAIACDDACRRQQLLFVRNGRIHFLVAGVSIPLTAASGRAEDAPAWSPDGQRIAFVRYDPFVTPQIYLMDPDGSNVVRRATGFNAPAWSPDGRWLAVDTGLCVYECDIYRLSVDPDGAAPVHLTAMGKQPAWSPDGTRIAFVSLSGDDGYHALHVMNADGTAVTAITSRDEGSINHPSWSPDGRRIAFGKCIHGACGIVTVNADGSDAEQLTTGTTAVSPAWSPDGSRIAFTSRAEVGDPTNSSVAWIAADGRGEPIPLASPGHSPAWRP
jgi:hypothetical protein